MAKTPLHRKQGDSTLPNRKKWTTNIVPISTNAILKDQMLRSKKACEVRSLSYLVANSFARHATIYRGLTGAGLFRWSTLDRRPALYETHTRDDHTACAAHAGWERAQRASTLRTRPVSLSTSGSYLSRVVRALRFWARHPTLSRSLMQSV